MQDVLKLAHSADADGLSASAFELFKRAGTLDGGKDSTTYRAVINLLEIGRITDAEVFLTKIRWNAAPKPWLIEFVLGKLRLAQFKPSEAEKHFRNALQLNPTCTSPAVLLANCLSKQEKFDEAKTTLIEALKSDGDLDEVYLNLGLIERAKCDYETARSYLLKALVITPDYQDAKRILADVEFWLRVKDQH